MMLLTKSVAFDHMVFLVSDTDHSTGVEGATLTIIASKAGAAFASISPTVTERGDGWYKVALTTTHTNTAGVFALHIEAADADPIDEKMQVADPAVVMIGVNTVEVTGAAPEVGADIVDDVLRTALVESYAADGAAGTLSQILFGLQAFMQERSVSGTTLTVKKLDGSTTAMTFTLNSGTTPTSVTRS